MDPDVRPEAVGVADSSGARVPLRLTMSNPARRYHVALVDPLPPASRPKRGARNYGATAEELTESGVNRGGPVYMIITGPARHLV